MATYKIEVIETLSRIVEVEATDGYQAAEIVAGMYDNEEIVLDADDYCETKFAYLEGNEQHTYYL